MDPNRYESAKQLVSKSVVGFLLLWISYHRLGMSDVASLRSNNMRSLQTDSNSSDETGEYVVDWSISLGGKESIIQSSSFLKAGLEQTIKEHINSELECDSDIDTRKTAFHSVSITNSEPMPDGKMLRIMGSSKCNGNKEKCRNKMKKVIRDADFIDDDDDSNDDNFSSIGGGASNDNDFLGKENDEIIESEHTSMMTNAMGSTLSKMEVCKKFKASRIFDVFKKILITASSFKYNVDVDVINDLSGKLSLTYNVTFKPAPATGLSQIKNIALDASEPRLISTQCLESHCTTQRSVMRNIFNHFGINFDETKHECLHRGVNCDLNDLVTHIWISKC